MAGKFPLTYSDIATYGTDTNNANPYYYIHNVANLSIFSPEDPAAFDVYHFLTVEGDDDAPRQAYSLVVIKNMGSAASDVEVSNVDILTGPSGFNPFSLVTQLSDIHAEAFQGKDANILTPSEFNALDGPSSETNVKLQYNPLGYIKLETASGDVTSESFDGSGVKYIPFYNPKNDGVWGICKNTGDAADAKIGAATAGGTTYPEYAAFVIKCAPTTEMDIEDATLQIVFTNPSNAEYNINLAVTSYRKGSLKYEQGFWNTYTESLVAVNGVHGSIATEKDFVTNDVEYDESFGGVFPNANLPSTFINNNYVLNTPAFDDTKAVNDMVNVGFFPFGYQFTNATAHITNPDANVNYAHIYVKAYDETTHQGGIRFLSQGDGITTYTNDPGHGASVATNAYMFDFLDGTGAELSYFVKPPGANEFNPVYLGGDTGSFTFKMTESGEGSAIYARLLPDSLGAFFTTAHNYRHYSDGVSPLLHPDVGTHFATDTSIQNRRVVASGLPMFHNPFFIDEAAAADDVNNERVHQDNLFVVYGNYNVWSTNVATGTKYCRFSTISNLSSDVDAAYDIRGRLGNRRITEHMAGALKPNAGFSSSYKETAGMGAPTPDGAITPTDGSGKATVWKHKHIADMFILPKETGSTIGLGNIELQFNNLSGLAAFFGSEFNFESATINTQGTRFLSADEGSSTTITPVACDNENFSPNGVVDGSGNTPTSIATCFSEADAGIAWNTLATAGYAPNAKKKTVLLSIEHSRDSGNFYDSISWDGVGDFNSTPGNQPVIDGLGRLVDTGTFTFSGNICDAVGGTGGVPQQFTGNLSGNTLSFNFHAYNFYPKWTGFSRVSAGPDLSNCWVAKELYITNYAGNNRFGTHAGTGTRTALGDSNIIAASQSVTISTSNGTHGLTDGITAVKHEYAYVDVADTADYYYRKYPLNGPCVWKYEKYWKERVLRFDATEKYGPIPGPLAEGRFNSGDAVHLSSTQATEHNHVLEGNTGSINENRNRYEVYIPFNITNTNYHHAQILSIDLENRVGTAGASTGSFGTQAASFGDPRYIGGVASNGVYRTALHPLDGENNWSAPHVGGGYSPTLTVTVVVANGGECTMPSGANPAVIENMICEDVEGNSNIPADTTIQIYNSTRFDLYDSSGAKRTDAVNGTYDVVLDYPQPNYVIWDIVTGRKNHPNALESMYYQGLGDATNSVGLRESVVAAHDITSDNTLNDYQDNNNTAKNYTQGEFCTVNGNNIMYKSTGKFAPLESIPSSSAPPTNSLYHKYSQTPSEMNQMDISGWTPCIYFAIDNSALGVTAGGGASDFNNEIDSATYINRLRIRYIVHDPLDSYGTNQQNIGSDTMVAMDYSDSTDYKHVNVYEDTYLVVVNFSNLTPEARVYDIENNESEDGSTINFGILQVG